MAAAINKAYAELIEKPATDNDKKDDSKKDNSKKNNSDKKSGAVKTGDATPLILWGNCDNTGSRCQRYSYFTQT